MDPFKALTEVAVPISMDNVDTDQIIPARFMRKSRRDGMSAPFFFHDLRFNEHGSEKPDFILNRPEFRKARIVVAARNYACGSARIGAVYSHYDYGIRVVIAQSFGDVFYNNCLKNGILAVRLDEAQVARLRARLFDLPGATISVNLEQQTVSDGAGMASPFEVDSFAKHCLLNGLRDVAFTLEKQSEIACFESRYYQTMSWLRNRINQP